MKFDTPAGQNPIDRMTVVGQPYDRYEAGLKTTGTATYAYEYHDVGPDVAYGYILGAGVAKGRILSIDTRRAQAAPGVLAVVTYRNVGRLGVGKFYVQRMLAAPDVDHYHQPVAVVVAETFEQACAAAALIRVQYVRSNGQFDLETQMQTAPVARQMAFGGPTDTRVGDFEQGFAQAHVKVDETYTVPDQAHAMMEPHATIAKWDGDRVTCWTSIQQMNWGTRDLGAILGIPRENVRLISSFVGGGFGGKGTVQSDLALAAVAARMVRRPVKIALQRPIMFNNTIHRPKTIQRIRLGATRDGRLIAIGHESWSGNLAGGRTEPTTLSTRMLYGGPNRMTCVRLATLDLAEGNAMRAPGEAPGLMALEIAMDEMAEKLGMDPVEFRVRNDTQFDPELPQRPFSSRPFVECLRTGAERFGWNARQARPGQVRDGHWLVGLGMAAAIRGAPIAKAGARVRLDSSGIVTIETDMTDIGTGSYTVVQQTAAEMMGVPIDRVVVRLGDSSFPETPGSGGAAGRGLRYRRRLRRVHEAARDGRSAPRLRHCRGRVRRGRNSLRQQKRSARARGRQRTARRGGKHGVRRLVEAVRDPDVRRPLCRSRRERLHRRNPRAPNAGRLCGRPHTESQDGAQPGDRRNDDGNRRGVDGGDGGRQAIRALHQP